MAAPGPPVVAASPQLRYLEHYTQLQDVLQGNYTPLFPIHHLTTGQPSNIFFNTAVDSDTVPKVFLTLVLTPDGSYNVIALHNLWRFKPSMVAAVIPWDGKTFAFIGDIQPTSCFIRTVSFPDDVFDTVQEQRVHATNYITAAFTAGPNTILILNSVANNVPN